MNISLIIRPLRESDYERYLCCLLERPSVQPRLFALLAFNQELAKTAEAASEEQAGLIRLKWWQEALQELEAGAPPRRHPVAEALAALTPEDVAALYPLIEARQGDVAHRAGFPDKAAFDAYLERSAGYLHWLLAGRPEAARETIFRAGRFYGLIGLLRAMPYHLERGIVRLPRDILRRYGVSPAALEQGLEREAFGHFMAWWLEEADRQASALEPEIRALPRRLRLIRRLHKAALLYARALKHAGGDPSAMARRLPNLPLRLWWGGFTDTI